MVVITVAIMVVANILKFHLQITVVQSSLDTHQHHGHANLPMILKKIIFIFMIMIMIMMIMIMIIAIMEKATS